MHELEVDRVHEVRAHEGKAHACVQHAASNPHQPASCKHGLHPKEKCEQLSHAHMNRMTRGTRPGKEAMKTCRTGLNPDPPLAPFSARSCMPSWACCPHPSQCPSSSSSASSSSRSSPPWWVGASAPHGRRMARLFSALVCPAVTNMIPHCFVVFVLFSPLMGRHEESM